MKATHVCLAFTLGAIPMGCNRSAADETANALRSTKTLAIRYVAQKQPRSLTSDDPQQVADILATIEIDRVEKGAHVGRMPFGGVDFVLADGTTMATIFVRSTRLERSAWGQIYLRHDRFYRKICELASKAEGRPIDVLERN